VVSARLRFEREEAGAAARAAAAVPVEAAAAAQAVCLICSTAVIADIAGVFCSGSEPHALCGDCFEGYVRAHSSAEVGELQRGLICPAASAHSSGCDAAAFSEFVIARNSSGDAFAAYLTAVLQLEGARVRREADQEWALRVAALEAQLRAADASADARQARRRHIVDELLTSKCPRCAQAFVDYDNCAAVTCCRCGCCFCAYCLHDGGASTHAHMTGCASGPLRLHAVGGWRANHNRRCAERLRAYLATLDAEAKAHALLDCAQDLQELGLAAADYQ